MEFKLGIGEVFGLRRVKTGDRTWHVGEVIAGGVDSVLSTKFRGVREKAEEVVFRFQTWEENLDDYKKRHGLG